MSLNIKNEETHRLVQELASLTGESQTTAVTKAVEERLERLKSKNPDEVFEQVMLIIRDSASRFKEPYKSLDHGDFLYGPDGLPN